MGVDLRRGNYVIVPYRFVCADEINDLIHHYSGILNDVNEIDGVVIVVNADATIECVRAYEVSETDRLSILYLPEHLKSNGNQKLDAIFYAISQIYQVSKADFDGHLYDDDSRPSKCVLLSSIKSLESSDYGYRLCQFRDHHVFNMIEQSGLYIHNSLFSNPQIWANLYISQINRLPIDLMDSNHLYDEQYLINCTKRSIGDRLSFSTSPPLQIYGKRNFRTYFKQKLRYCYENLNFPMRFTFDLLIVPGTATLTWAYGIFVAVTSLGLISLGLVGCSFWYWAKIPPKERSPIWANLLGVFWYVPYPLLAWIALAMRFTTGIRFGANRIFRP